MLDTCAQAVFHRVGSVGGHTVEYWLIVPESFSFMQGSNPWLDHNRWCLWTMKLIQAMQNNIGREPTQFSFIRIGDIMYYICNTGMLPFYYPHQYSMNTKCRYRHGSSTRIPISMEQLKVHSCDTFLKQTKSNMLSTYD